MKFQDRAKIILELLEQQHTVKVQELSERFGVSVVIIRKDLQRLEDEGKLIRTFGGAASCIVDSKERRRQSSMQAIAERAAQEICEGDCVLLNAGTTTLLVAKRLRECKNLKVITNAIYVAQEMNRYNADQVFLLGGELGEGLFTHGSGAIEQLKQYKADKLILSASGLSCGSGITTRHMEAADLFRGMIECSREVIVVADDTKIGFESFYHVSDLKVVDKIVTNVYPENEPELRKMEEMGIQVYRCGQRNAK